MTQDEAIQKIKDISDKHSSFKIGKTGQELSDRFDSEYKEDYDKIIPICSSPKKEIIDQWEEELITYFQNDDDYIDKCDNDAIGQGDMRQSKKYRIYIVVKK